MRAWNIYSRNFSGRGYRLRGRPVVEMSGLGFKELAGRQPEIEFVISVGVKLLA